MVIFDRSMLEALSYNQLQGLLEKVFELQAVYRIYTGRHTLVKEELVILKLLEERIQNG